MHTKGIQPKQNHDLFPCFELEKFLKLINEHNTMSNNDNTEFFNFYLKDITKILDQFHYFLSHHNRDNKQFDEMYNKLLNKKCFIKNCNVIKRHLNRR